MNHGLIRPFVGNRMVSTTSRRWWYVFLLGAPLALGIAFHLQGRLTQHRDLRLTLTRDTAIAQARELGRSQGLPIEQWSGFVNFVRNEPIRNALDEARLPANHAAWQLAPQASVEVLLHPGDFSSRWRVRLSGDGRLLGFEIAGRLAEAQTGSSADPAMQRSAIEAMLARDIAQGAPLQFGEPEVENVEQATGAPGRRFTWHAALPDVASIEFKTVGEYRGSRLTRLEIAPSIRPDRQAVRNPLSGALQPVYYLARIVLIVFLAIYGCYRFARRSAEGEVPRGRALVLLVFVMLFGVALLIADPDFGIAQMDSSRLSAGYLILLRATLMANIALQGLLLGLAYASGEGEIREAFHGKLTSLDAALTGRVFSSNVGASVVFGAAAACWSSLLYQGLLTWLAPDDWRLPSWA